MLEKSNNFICIILLFVISDFFSLQEFSREANFISNVLVCFYLFSTTQITSTDVRIFQYLLQDLNLFAQNVQSSVYKTRTKPKFLL